MEERQQYLELDQDLEELVGINAEHRAHFAAAVADTDGSDEDMIELLLELAAGIVHVRNGIRDNRAHIAAKAERLDEAERVKRLQAIPMPDPTEEEIMQALSTAIRSWNEDVAHLPWWSGNDAIWTSSVAQVLAGRPATKSEVSRTAHRLIKLEATGRVERTTPKGETARWRPRAAPGA